MASFEKRKNGWTVRFRIILNGCEMQKRLSGFASKKDAERGYMNYLQEAKPSAKNGVYDFNALCELWLKNKKANIRESTFYELEGIIHKHILPFFNDQKVSKIKPADILKWQHEKSEFSYKYLKKLRTYLNCIFDFGEKFYDLPNPARKVEMPRNVNPTKPTINVITASQFEMLAEHIEDDIFRLFFKTLFYTGMRKGECLALHWSNVDLMSNKISIEQSLTRKGQAVYSLTAPKNASSIRIISIPSKIARELAKIKPNCHLDNFVFLKSGRPLAERSLDRAFNAAADQCGLGHIRIHDLRHSFVSCAISAGVPVVSISKHIGHSSVRQTLDTYTHLLKSDNDKMNDYIDLL